MTIRAFLLIFCTICAFTACQKQPGYGGNASIKGNVHVKNYNATFTVLLDEYAGADEDVYLVAGDNVAYLDRIKTNYNGDFEFDYLYKGKYQLYIYSKDSSLQAPNGMIPIIRNIEITENKQVLDLDTITIFN